MNRGNVSSYNLISGAATSHVAATPRGEVSKPQSARVFASSYNLISGEAKSKSTIEASAGGKRMTGAPEIREPAYNSGLKHIAQPTVPEDRPNQRKTFGDKPSERSEEAVRKSSVRLHMERTPTTSNDPIPSGGSLVDPKYNSRSSVANSDDNRSHKYVAQPKQFRPAVNPYIQKPQSTDQGFRPSFAPNEQYSHSRAISSIFCDSTAPSEFEAKPLKGPHNPKCLNSDSVRDSMVFHPESESPLNPPPPARPQKVPLAKPAVGVASLIQGETEPSSSRPPRQAWGLQAPPPLQVVEAEPTPISSRQVSPPPQSRSRSPPVLMEDFEPTTFEAPPSLQPSRAHSPKTRRSSVAAEPAFDRNQSLTSRHEAAALRREQLQAARAAGIAAKSTAARKKMAAPPVIVENPDQLYGTDRGRAKPAHKLNDEEKEFKPSVRQSDRAAAKTDTLPMGGKLGADSRMKTDRHQSSDTKFTEGPKSYKPLVNPRIQRPESSEQVIKRVLKPNNFSSSVEYNIMAVGNEAS